MSVDKCISCDKELGVIGDVDESYKVLVLNRGDTYLDFCSKCGETETLTNETTGEVLTFNQVYNKKSQKPKKTEVLTNLFKQTPMEI
jgi:hypothetical protein